MEIKMEDDNFYKRIHYLDQASASFAVIASILGAYFEQLNKSGFTRQEAFSLVKLYQKNLLKLQLKMMIDMDAAQKATDSENVDEDKNENGDDDEYFRN